MIPHYITTYNLALKARCALGKQSDRVENSEGKLGLPTDGHKCRLDSSSIIRNISYG